MDELHLIPAGNNADGLIRKIILRKTTAIQPLSYRLQFPVNMSYLYVNYSGSCILKNGTWKKLPHVFFRPVSENSIKLCDINPAVSLVFQLSPEFSYTARKHLSVRTEEDYADLSALMPDIIQDLDRKLNSEPYETSRRIEDALFKMWSQHCPPSVLHESMSVMDESNGRLRIADLADKTGFTRQTIHRLFTGSINLSPKAYAEIVRFSKTLELMSSGLGWADILSRTGYVDYSHMNRFIKRFSGFTYSELLRHLQRNLNEPFQLVDPEEKKLYRIWIDQTPA